MPAPMLEQSAGEKQLESLEKLQQKRELSFDEKVLMTTLSWKKEAEQNHLLNLAGHRSVGGMRASIYNAVPLEGVQALVNFMDDFAKRHG